VVARAVREWWSIVASSVGVGGGIVAVASVALVGAWTGVMCLLWCEVRCVGSWMCREIIPS
jgi:hypothetical protein